MIKDGIRDGYIEPYDNMSNKEILEYNDDVYEANDVRVSTVKLEPTEFEGSDAIEIYIQDFDKENEYMVGYVPKKDINDVLDFLLIHQEHPEYVLEADAYFTGGKFKTTKYDDEKDKDVIVTDERNYGINVNIKLYKNE